MTNLRELALWLRKPLHLCVTSISFLLIGITGGFVVANVSQIPFAEEWLTSVPLAIKIASGEFTIGDVFTPYLEHHIVFTNLVTVLNTYSTGFDNYWGTLINIVLLFLTLMLLVDLLRRDAAKLVALLLIPYTVLLFSLRGRENLLWAFATQHSFVVFFFVAALWTLRVSTVGWKALALSACLCLCATLSFASGLAAWLVLSPYGYKA